ncbi:hypothetical protein [Enterovirga aerilata]|uniref:Uncharacterized protein n=1 Tax=Enterovirga aerilata TaxID=2730920 RepID=A0A849IG54_9HYPH|nr:hypothetical protein [Enterovirga sp. DB1703]NNM75195.1 hypothetical protein [Enterovirga sp. DB1703]
MERHRPTLRLLEATGGFLAWGAQFAILYMAVSVACARGWGSAKLLGLPALPAVIVLSTLAALAAAAALLLLGLKRRKDTGLTASQDFLNNVTILVSALSLVAIVYNALPGLLLPSCS